jgi:hypothetical protein
LFIGHFAIGFASKRLAPHTSLATLIAAPVFLDILFPVFVLTGREHARIAPGTTRIMPIDLYDYVVTACSCRSCGRRVRRRYFSPRNRGVAIVLGAGSSATSS